MTNDRIKELRALCEAATPGPWVVTRHNWECGSINWLAANDRDVDGNFYAHIQDGAGGDPGERNPRAKQDAAFIAAARTALPEALDEVERLRGYNEHADWRIGQLEDERDDARLERDEARRLAVQVYDDQDHEGDVTGCLDREDIRAIAAEVEAYRGALS